MLRSVAARYEGNGYGFCTVIFWAILLEIHTVIIPAYLPFITPAIVLQHYEGSLHNIAKLYIVISTILTFQVLPYLALAALALSRIAWRCGTCMVLSEG
eukprot:scaffold115231_cov38-Tisochrysis_lutea.AAC.2